MRKTVLILTVITFTFASVLTSCGGKEKEKSSSKQIIGFSITTPPATGIINEQAKTILAFVPGGTAITSLTPTISISEGAAISPASGVATNFTNPVKYTVTAEDGSTVVYTVTVIAADKPYDPNNPNDPNHPENPVNKKNIIKVQLEGYPQWTAHPDSIGGFINSSNIFQIAARGTSNYPYIFFQGKAEVSESGFYWLIKETSLIYAQETALSVEGITFGDWVSLGYTFEGGSHTTAQLYITEFDLVNLTISGKIDGYLLNTVEAFSADPSLATRKTFNCEFTKIKLNRTTVSSASIKDQKDTNPQISKAKTNSISNTNRVFETK